MSLDKGQQDLKTLILKEKNKNKKKKRTTLLNMGHRFGNRLRQGDESSHPSSKYEDDSFVTSVEDIVTPLMTIKQNLLLAGLFPGCDEGCRMCSVLPTGCPLLKSGVQRLMDNK